jgi:hypothetical protein
MNHRLVVAIITTVQMLGCIGLLIFTIVVKAPGIVTGLVGILVGLATALMLVSWDNWSKSRIGGRW